MNLEHKEKQEVFDEYARNLNLKDWEELMYVFRHNIKNELTKLIFNATDLVQKKALERASENAKIKLDGDQKVLKKINGETTYFDPNELSKLKIKIDKESITNENNLIK